MKQSSISLSNSDVIQVLKLELTLHPQAQLLDLYKLLIQAFFGPAHFVVNRDDAAKSIFDEASRIKDRYLPLVQDIGNSAGYVRYSLSNLFVNECMSDYLLITECYDLADKMIESCSLSATSLSIVDCWNRLVPDIKTIFDAPDNAWDAVCSFAKEGFIPNHSPVYKQLYDPHYRIILSALFTQPDSPIPHIKEHS